MYNLVRGRIKSIHLDCSLVNVSWCILREHVIIICLMVIMCIIFTLLGSHNAITYCLDMNDRSPVDLTQPDMLQKLDKYMKPLIRPFVYKWAVTQVTDHRRWSYIFFSTGPPSMNSWLLVLQEYTIKQQLDCGVRYCDLRIAHRPNDSSSDLYFYHGVYTTLTVEVQLQHAATHVYTTVIHSWSAETHHCSKMYNCLAPAL